MTTLNQKIESLKAGQLIVISQCNNITCSCERSGDGKTLRFVRTQSNGSFEVYKTTRF